MQANPEKSHSIIIGKIFGCENFLSSEEMTLSANNQSSC